MLYVLEANPRASRTVPFVSKATGVPLAKAAARVMLGATIAELRAEGLLPADGDGGTLPAHAPVAVKEAVMPFNRFRTVDGRSVDTVLGPEMRSTGEVMGIDAVFGTAFAKAQAGGVRRAADRGQGVRVGGQPRQAAHGVPGQAAGRPGLRDPRHQRHGRRCCAATASRPRWSGSSSERADRGVIGRVPDGPDSRPTPRASRAGRPSSR